MKRIVLAAAALLALVALAGAAAGPEGAGAAEAPAQAERTVTVSGTGTVRSTPDRAQISFGVETRGATARAALAANAAEMRKVIDALRTAGVSELATQGVSVWPSYGDENRVLGYTATNTVSGVVDADRAGAIIDAAVAAGANQIYGPSFTKEDADRLYREALELAVNDARARAETLAAAAGGRLGRVLSVTESSTAPIPVMERAAASDAGTPVLPGRVETSATISITFALT